MADKAPPVTPPTSPAPTVKAAISADVTQVEADVSGIWSKVKAFVSAHWLQVVAFVVGVALGHFG